MTQPVPVLSTIRLSIILPWYRKLTEFQQVLPFNVEAWRRPDLEVILVLDEPSEEIPLIALLKGYPDIRWQVIVNDQSHPWRPPCKAINVGIRHAQGRFVLVASPESAYVGEVPEAVLRTLDAVPHAVVIGRVGFASLRELNEVPDLKLLFHQKAPPLVETRSYYGSMAVAREAIEAIGGYDETFTSWGGDDDNLRVRLEMAGHPLVGCPDLQLLHLSVGERPSARNPDMPFNPWEGAKRCAPSRAISPHPLGWGRSFSRVALDSLPSPVAGPRKQVYPARDIRSDLFFTVSVRSCPSCGRQIYHAVSTPPCPQCNGAITLPPATIGLLAERSRAIKVFGVLQVHNEESYLPGCLDHLRPFVDGFVVLDDGSTDKTREVLNHEPKLLALLENPTTQPHRWNEPENRRRVLTEALRLGADWVLCCDADERFETAFLRRMRSISAVFPGNGRIFLSLLFRELWNSPIRFRVDGVWGSKRAARFFSLPDEISFDLSLPLHSDWYPDGVRVEGQGVMESACIYHLKSIFQTDRISRRDFYKNLDPDCLYQKIGYDYLAEEGPEMQFQTIASARGYDLTSLPPFLQF